jgi:hypothetical protein
VGFIAVVAYSVYANINNSKAQEVYAQLDSRLTVYENSLSLLDNIPLIFSINSQESLNEVLRKIPMTEAFKENNFGDGTYISNGEPSIKPTFAVQNVQYSVDLQSYSQKDIYYFVSYKISYQYSESYKDEFYIQCGLNFIEGKLSKITMW